MINEILEIKFYEIVIKMQWFWYKKIGVKM